MSGKIVIVDFGSQYTHLIARRLRSPEIGVWCEIVTPSDQVAGVPGIAGVILSGGPGSVAEDASVARAPELTAVLRSGVPVLGVCFGMQLIAGHHGGCVERSAPQFGPAQAHPTELAARDELLRETGLAAAPQIVWMSHGESVTRLPDTVSVLLRAEDGTPVGVRVGRVWGLQFHPEVAETSCGTALLRAFAETVCGVPAGSWTTQTRLEQALAGVRETVTADDFVVLGLSGGVDSMVVAALLARVLRADQWLAVHVDHGMMRWNESEAVLATCAELGVPVQKVDASRAFLGALAGVRDPETKRRVIGELFVRTFEEATKHCHATVLAQGTIYPDVVESARAKHGAGTSGQHVIKSHHNVGGLPSDMRLRVLEPIRWLFKDEVRDLGRTLGIPEEVLGRHPFPGPGLAIRIVGEVEEQKVRVVRQADRVFDEHLRRAGLYSEVSQAYAALLDVRAVGVVGDRRRYGWVVVLRAVCTGDFMTCSVARLSVGWLEVVASDICARCPEVARVMFDVTSKPPGTIELE